MGVPGCRWGSAGSAAVAPMVIKDGWNKDNPMVILILWGYSAG